MLKHVVLFKFRKEAAEAEISEVERGLRGLPAIISEIREYQLGRDIVQSERSYDLALVSAFESMDAMKRYQVHAAHQAILEKIKKACESIIVVDFVI